MNKEELMPEDRRLIEDFIPIQAISEAARSEPRAKGHISTLHIWRARRPMTACRAAVYAALVPSERERSKSAQFLTQLCKYDADPVLVEHARHRIAEAHAARLSRELGTKVSVKEILDGAKPAPKVIDIFAGGGAIPLEAARLGCNTLAIELNPVAHLIELCTVRFPQQFGSSLADDVETWGRQVLDRVQAETADLYPVIHHGSFRGDRQASFDRNPSMGTNLSVVAFYWTRTVPCPNPSCRGTVPLYGQTWLRKRPGGFVALKPNPDMKKRRVSFEVVQKTREDDFDFNPGAGIEGSATTCPYCAAAVKAQYVRQFGDETGFGQQLMSVIALNPNGAGKLYLTDESLMEGEAERQQRAEERAAALEAELGNSSLDEVIPPTGNAGLATGKSYLYGIRTFRHAFLPRQRCVLLTLAREIRRAHTSMLDAGIEKDRAKAITTYLGLWLSRLTDRFSSISRWDNTRENIQGMTSLKRFAMAWDFPELNLFGGASGDAWGNLQFMTAVLRREGRYRNPVTCIRTSATELRGLDGAFDAVITDPPYYDNESYSELSDVCYVWLRPTLSFLYPEHFASPLTPKRQECVKAIYRQGGTDDAAKRFFEDCLYKALLRGHDALKADGVMVLMYAHKTTAGWATLVDSIRRAGFEVTEAWPVETETKERVAHQGDAALASTIFLVARKRTEPRCGQYETEVRPVLESIVSERVATLWELGVSGADLVIACLGAGLSAFTRFLRVEYANGEDVPAERFLAEVETVVLEEILAKLSRTAASEGSEYDLGGLDPSSRFYLLWRYTYGTAELDAGEAIVFANGTHVELDGLNGLSSGSRPLLQKKKGTYRLRDFTDRGSDERLGVPSEHGQPAPLVDALQRTLWLMENRPARIGEFLREAQPNLEQMRLVAQALAGPALKGGELANVSPSNEVAALGKLTANWRSVIEGAGFGAEDLLADTRGVQIK